MIKQITTGAIVVMCFSLFMGLMVGNALNKQEINECNKWKGQMETIEKFYVAEWQQEQCNFHGIIIK